MSKLVGCFFSLIRDVIFNLLLNEHFIAELCTELIYLQKTKEDSLFEGLAIPLHLKPNKHFLLLVELRLSHIIFQGVCEAFKTEKSVSDLINKKKQDERDLTNCTFLRKAQLEFKEVGRVQVRICTGTLWGERVEVCIGVTAISLHGWSLL